MNHKTITNGQAMIPESMVELATPMDDLKTYPGNPRRGDIDAIAESLATNGQYRPIVLAADGTILAGNHTYLAAKSLGWEQIAAVRLPIASDGPEATRIVLADNRTADLGTYDDGSLIELLDSLTLTDVGLEGSGYDDKALTDLLDSLDDHPYGDTGDDTDRAPSTGELLSIADIAYGEPTTTTTTGQVWQLGRHTLVIVDPVKDWPAWHPYLKPGMLFCPYPDLYLTATDTLMETPALLIQPRPYLAGHMIDKHRSIFPDESVELA
jgi:ParB-like nuclease domain